MQANRVSVIWMPSFSYLTSFYRLQAHQLSSWMQWGQQTEQHVASSQSVFWRSNLSRSSPLIPAQDKTRRQILSNCWKMSAFSQFHMLHDPQNRKRATHKKNNAHSTKWYLVSKYLSPLSRDPPDQKKLIFCDLCTSSFLLSVPSHLLSEKQNKQKLTQRSNQTADKHTICTTFFLFPHFSPSWSSSSIVLSVSLIRNIINEPHTNDLKEEGRLFMVGFTFHTHAWMEC